MLAYDFNELVKKLKEAGVEAAEETAKAIVKAVFAWGKESAALGTKPIVDSLVLMAMPAEAFLLAQADKINPAD